MADRRQTLSGQTRNDGSHSRALRSRVWSEREQLPATSAGGNEAMTTTIDDKYLGVDGQRLLGIPTGPENLAPDGVGRFRMYERGAIYWSPRTRAHEVHGAIFSNWASLGWERSWLGYPRSDETTAPDGVSRFNHFEFGSIYWEPGYAP